MGLWASLVYLWLWEPSTPVQIRAGPPPLSVIPFSDIINKHDRCWYTPSDAGVTHTRIFGPSRICQILADVPTPSATPPPLATLISETRNQNGMVASDSDLIDTMAVSLRELDSALSRKVFSMVIFGAVSPLRRGVRTQEAS